ncbi:MAG: histidine kinase [Bacteroidota bacterium]
MKYAQQAYRVATLEGEEFYKGVSLYYQSLIKSRWQKFGDGLEDALNDARMAKSLFENNSEYEWLTVVHSLNGTLFRKQFEFNKKGIDSSRIYLNLALQNLARSGYSFTDSLALAGEILHSIGTTYIDGDSSTAIQYLKKAEALYVKSNHFSALARLWKDQGQVKLNNSAFMAADSLFKKSHKYAEVNNDKALLVDVLETIGLLNRSRYLATLNDSFALKAIQNFQDRIIAQEENQYDSYQEIAITYHFQAYYKQSANDSSAYFQKLDSAISYNYLALKDAEDEGSFQFMKDLVLNLNGLCEGRQEDRNLNCQAFLKMPIMEFVTQVYQNQLDTIFMNLQASSQNIQSFQREEIKSEASRSKRNQIIIGGIILGFSILIFLLSLQRVQQKRLKARMEALRAQINPHFMSNSLNAIESLVNTDQKEAASKYLVHFSRLTRQILNQSRETTVSLKAELKTLEHFLALEQLRFRDKLYYSVGVDEEINPLLVEIPSMILQPYVENAIWHGIKPKVGPGMLEVRVRKEGNRLIVIVEDDGIGRQKAAELKAQSSLNKQKSVGMSITKERIRGSTSLRKSQIQIQDLYDEDGEAAGTRVVIQLPYKLMKRKA